MHSSLSPSSLVEICEASNHVDKKKKKRKIKKKKYKQITKSQQTAPRSDESVNMPTKHVVILSSLVPFARAITFLMIVMVCPKF